MNICVYGSSSDMIDKGYLEAGVLLGEEIAKRGHALVFGGGAQGLMGAAARGTAKYGGKIVGVAPSFFKVDGALFPDCREFIYTETMRERKQILEERSDAFIMTPGGVGTYEEFFEMVTLKQLGKTTKAIAVLNTGGFYNDMNMLMENLAEKGFMKEKSLELYRLLSTPKEVLDYIEGYKPEKYDIRNMKYIK